MTERRFPPPWTAEVTPNCFIVRDANGQALSYVYYESEPGTGARRPSCSAKTRSGGLRTRSPSCRSYCGSLEQERKRFEAPTNGLLLCYSPRSFSFA